MNEDGFKRARYSDVERRVWNDPRFRALSQIPPCGAGLWLYLLTTPELGVMPGIILMGEAAMAEHLGWPLGDFREVFREVFAQGMVEADWTARLVVTGKAIRRRIPESPNVIKSWRQQWLEVPDCELKLKYFQELKAFVQGFPEAFRKVFGEAIAEPSRNQIQIQTQIQTQILQEKTGEDLGGVGGIASTSRRARSRKSGKSEARGSRMQADWRPSNLSELAASLRLLAAQVEARLPNFVDYWLAATGRNAAKKDWDATLRVWLRREIDEGKLQTLAAPAKQLPPAKPLFDLLKVNSG